MSCECECHALVVELAEASVSEYRNMNVRTPENLAKFREAMAAQTKAKKRLRLLTTMKHERTVRRPA